MKWPDPIDMMDENERALLLPGETPLAFEIAMQMPGYDAIGRDERARANVTFERPDPISLALGTEGLLDVNNDWMDQKLSGTTAAGGLNSIAAGFQHAITDVGTKKLLVSTSRIALIGDEGKVFGSSPTTIKWELDRRAAHAEHARRLTQMGRVRLRFADGSWAMLMLGIFLTRAAKRVIRAVNAPHQPQANQPGALQPQPNHPQPNHPQPNQPPSNWSPSNWPQQHQTPSQPHGTPNQPSSYGTPPPGQYGAARPPVGPPQPPQDGAGQPQHGAAPPRPPQPGTPPQQHGAPPQAPPYGAPHPGPQQPPQFGTPPPHHQPPR